MARTAIRFSDEALRLHRQFAQQVAKDGANVRVQDLGQDTKPLAYERVARDEGSTGTSRNGGGSGMQEGTHQAFRRENADAMKGHDDGPVAQEPNPGPQVQINTNSPQEGTSAPNSTSGWQGTSMEGQDTNLHGGYRRYWNHHARDGVGLKYAEGVTKDELAEGQTHYTDPHTGLARTRSLTEGVGEKLPSAVGLSGEATDSYGELLDSVASEHCNSQMAAALKAVLASLGFSPSDAEMICQQSLLAPPGMPNDRGTGASADAPGTTSSRAQVGGVGTSEMLKTKLDELLTDHTMANRVHAMVSDLCGLNAGAAMDEPPDLPATGAKPETGGTMTPLKGNRPIVGDHIGYAFSTDCQPVRLRSDAHTRNLEVLAQRSDLPEARKMALDELTAQRTARHSEPSAIFKQSGAGKIGWAA